MKIQEICSLNGKMFLDFFLWFKLHHFVGDKQQHQFCYYQVLIRNNFLSVGKYYTIKLFIFLPYLKAVRPELSAKLILALATTNAFTIGKFPISDAI